MSVDRKRVLLNVTLIVSSVSTVVAVSAEEPVTTLGAVEVWGTEIKSSSVKLDDETIAVKQAEHISDLLRPIPGVDVGGAHSLNQRITIRSMDDKDLRISIDGANQNTYMYHHMGNLQINADILEEVDVKVGTNSVVDGGLGGGVSFKTKQAKQLLTGDKRFGGNVKLSGGDNSGENASLTLYGQLTDSLDVLMYHNQVKRDNYEVGGGEIKDFDGNTVEGTNGEVSGLKGDLSDTLLKFGYDVGDNHRFELGYESYKDEGDYTYRPDMGVATDLAITNSLGVPLLWPTEFTRDTLTFNYEGILSDNATLKATAFRNESKLKRDETGWASNEAFASSAGIVTGEAINTGLNLSGDVELGKHTLTYGTEVVNYDTDFDAAYTSGASEQSSESATNTALFLQDRYQFTDKLAITPGIRYNHYKIDSSVTDNTFSKTTGALALEYQATDSLQLKLGQTQLFKGPEIGEVFTGAGLYETENQNIQAETGTNTELSVAFEKSMFGADRFAAGATLFQTKLDKYIYDYALNDDGDYWKDNVGDMTINGFEAYLGYDKGNLTTLLSYSKAESELDAFDDYKDTLDGARLDRSQGNTVALNVGYKIPSKNLSLHWDVMNVASLSGGTDLDGATANNKKDGFTVHNVSANWKPSRVKGLDLTLGVDNLFDEYYASQSSRTGLSYHPRFGDLYLQDFEPGRNIKLTASYRF
ncbi:TonB-dependent receptor domain-containing protein [Leucothrix mucor]|uniref:TonB-dependent receptor domain-containing protein n=1 Tax=Leucothrix mucor TaxID=45248 RepID=UPI0003B42048|nr:TonB-dependent receptor [Leucothrix mucor]